MPVTRKTAGERAAERRTLPDMTHPAPLVTLRRLDADDREHKCGDRAGSCDVVAPVGAVTRGHQVLAAPRAAAG